MKIIYILLVSVLSVGFVQGQKLLTIEPGIIKKQITIELNDAGYEEVLKVVVTNTSGRTLKLRWDKNIVYQPNAWESQICDKEASYPPSVESNYDPIQGVMTPVELAAGESFDLYLTLLPYNRTGQCKIEIPFREVQRPRSVIGTAVFQVNIINNQNVKNKIVSNQGIRVFPNPVHEHFFLSNIPQLGSLEVYNTLGMKVKSFNAPEVGDSFDIGDLPQGIYMVRLRDKEGEEIRTLKVLRRDFRP